MSDDPTGQARIVQVRKLSGASDFGITPRMGSPISIDLPRFVAALRHATEGDDPQFSKRGLSLAAELHSQAVYDIISGRNKDPDPSVVMRITDALGLPATEFVKIAGAGLPSFAGDFVEVRGSVAAGVWRESTEWEPDDRFRIVVGPNPVPGARRYGLRVDGDSMDLVYPDGSFLDVLSAYDLSTEPMPGDHVIVERICFDGTRELTVKEWAVDDAGKAWLIARSSKPQFQAPIPAHDGDERIEETKVCAIVIGSYRPTAAFRRSLS
ncbi:LexA family transcriptional regulator [Bradyrhizobium sp.]|uniref:LexA family protein n=1 Tax=Bradyrhizobium sp. TaxID=376 RepID=UPI0025BBDB2E|nr:S24 family peptidase [Bradyrhizobium sp.]MCA3566276.1 hypothetical protein [Bradyrhizobium sp.]